MNKFIILIFFLIHCKSELIDQIYSVQSLNYLDNDDSVAITEKQFSVSELNTKLPEEFDARNKWLDCPTIGEIRDQGACRASWADVSSGAMSDRYCIHSNGTKHFRFSSQDIVSCCKECGRGCLGGFPGNGWQYFYESGVVSGGPYNSEQGCKPYLIPPCEHNVNNGSRPKCEEKVRTPVCTQMCQKNYNVLYENDKHFGQKPYIMSSVNETLIRLEIFNNGPVETVLDVYEDFEIYKTGIYQHVNGSMIGMHSVRIIGWGIENNIKYWLIANNWNTDWGDNGYFKILRGSNHCSIETRIVAALPDYSKQQFYYFL